ncbi:hypothetical protein YYE_03497 [Plasmodium vinckei vinckei]|uniref:PIR protein CIR protein n=1 Tax=Plasmodium vinckei vinckei TaxID=54757 RepID=A0A081ICJ3_PLAVN|nr:hypothetical protein YYE_03497 [Plasmodium vinckei vinckei]
MDPKICDFLREVDNIFTRGVVNEKKFNNFTECHSYCPYQSTSKENKCTNGYERINALGSYLFNKIHEFDKSYSQKYGVSKHIEVFMIWLGSKLFKMDNDYKGTLEESYKNNLENIMENVNYWEIISKKLYKNATIRKMDELYSLLDNVCKLINEYNTNIQNLKNLKKQHRTRLGNHGVQCRNFYKSIHKSINGCRPYLHLLDYVKMMYENFKSQQIDNNNNIPNRDKILLLNNIQPLTTFNNENKLFVPVAANFSFDDKEYAGKSKNAARRPQTGVSGNSQHGNPGSSQLKPGPRPQPQPQPQKKPGAKPGAKPGGQPKISQQNQTQPVASVQSTDPQKKGPLPSVPEPNKLQPSPAPPVAPVKPPVLKSPEQPPAQTGGGKSIQPQPPILSQKKEQSSPTTTVQQPPSALPPASISKNDPSLQASKKSEASHQNGTKDSGSTKGSKGSGANALGGGTSQPENSEGKPKDDPQKKTDQVGNSSQGPKGSSQSTGVRNQGAGTGSETISGAGGQGGSGNQVNTGSQTKPSVDSPQGNSPPASSGTGTPQSVQSPPGPQPDPSTAHQPNPPVPVLPQPSPSQESSQQIPPTPTDPPTPAAPSPQNGSSSQKSQGGSNGQDPPNISDNSKKNTGGSGSGGDVNPGDGSNGPTSSTSGGSFDWGSSIFKFILNGAENLKKTSEFIHKNQEKVKEVTDKISNVYNDAKDNLKNVYDKSSSYFNEFINNVTSQFNQVGSPPKSGGNHPGLGSPSGGGNSNNQLQSPQSSSATDPKDPLSNQPPTSPTIDPTLQKQPPSQSQTITQQLPQVPVKVNQHNHKAIIQLENH